jgi:hypothetical protein
LECSHHCKFEIRLYCDGEMAYTVDMNRLSVCQLIITVFSSAYRCRLQALIPTVFLIRQFNSLLCFFSAQGEGKCFNKLFLLFKETLLNKTSVDALDISVAAENQSIDICDLERDIGPITEPEVSSATVLSSTTSFFYVSESISLFCSIHLTLLFRFNFTNQVLATLRPIKHMAICNKYEAQCETTRMLCMLSKRPEIHSYINKFGIVTILVKDLLNTRYSLFVSLPHKHQKW